MLRRSVRERHELWHCHNITRISVYIDILPHIKRDLRFFEERLRRAIPVDPPESLEEVVFGLTVMLVDADENQYCFTLVGEDETDIKRGRLCWAAPLAKLLIGRQVGDEIVWPRGGERLELEIVEISSLAEDR